MALAARTHAPAITASSRPDGWRLPSALRTLDALGVAFVVFGPDLRIRSASEAAITTLGAPLGEHASSPWRRLMDIIEVATRTPDQRRSRKWLVPLTDHCAVNVRRDVAGVDLGAVVAILQPCGLVTREQELAGFGLTGREAEVARLVAAGHATKEIAAILRISFHTARHHKERVFAKLGARCRVAVARIVLAREST